jgi:magnesium-transporting ATPase (P-type)
MAKANNFEISENTSFYSLTTDEAIELLQTDPKLGLSHDEVSRRLKRFGKNTLPEVKAKGIWSRILTQINNPLILVLIAAGVITLLLRDYLDSAVIFAVVIINAIIGFVQEGKAESALAAVKAMLADKATVIRDGEKLSVSSKNLVPGDLVFLESGDKVPADIRIIQAHNLRIEESALTGESIPSEKSIDAVLNEAQIGDQGSMAFSGTLVVYGQARGIVVSTGLKTEVGKIGALVGEAASLTTPLTKRLDLFAKQITVFILILGLAVFIYANYVYKMTQLDAFLIVVGMAVAAIPEGLPAIITIVLAIGTRTLAHNQAIIRRLPAVETLGSVTVICSDKTGTLTRNEMTTVQVILRDSSFEVTGVGYEPVGDFFKDSSPVDPLETKELKNLIRAAALCNDASLKQKSDNSWKIIGDPTEGALLVLAQKAGFSLAELHSDWPRIDQIPFESENRFMASLHQNEDEKILLFLKGAPEKVLELCGLSQDKYWLEQINNAGTKGQRVLGFAVIEFDEAPSKLSIETLPNNLNFLGMTGLIDPPRVEAIGAIKECSEAGITVKMITGDHAATAASIGRELGLNSEIALTGDQIEKMSDEELMIAIKDHDVIARANPEHKMRLVLALQKLGHYVAMTGDGVNDSPALKSADIGIAMGNRGTDAAKDASDLVLTDDNFATIATAVKQGRVVFDNIKKSLLFILPTNGGETGLILMALLIGLTMPVTVAQILWVNMVTTVTLAIALAFEPPEVGLMRQPPRPPKERLITRPFLIRVIFVSILMVVITLIAFEWELARGSSIEVARTTAVNMLVFAELTYLFHVRHFTKSSLNLKTFTENKVAVRVSIILIIMQVSFTYLPFFNSIFSTAPLDLNSWILIISLGLAKFLAIEIEKIFWRRSGIERM